MNEFKQTLGLIIVSICILTACAREGATDPAADSNTAEQTPAAGPTPAPTPTVWTACAPENGVCLFDGIADVRYGLDGVYITKSATYAMACNNVAFAGDPVPGVAKTCEYGNLVPTAPADDGGWIFCAMENQHCDFSGNAEVRYGFNHIFVTQDFTNGIDCNNQTFGDPLPGIGKKCEYRIK